MKKIFLNSTIACFLLSQQLQASPEGELEKAYMLGAFHSLEQLERNFRIQGINQERIDFNKFIVAVDVSTLATYKVLIYQQIGYTESLTPILVNDKYMVFNSYDRKADAIYLQEKILNSFHFKNKDEKAIILENNNPNGWFKSKFVQNKLFDTLLAEVNKNVKAKVFVVKDDNLTLDKKLDMIDAENKKHNIPESPAPVVSKTPVKVEKIPDVAMKRKPEDDKDVVRFKLKTFSTFFSYPTWKSDKILSKAKFVPKNEAKLFTNPSYKFKIVKSDDRGIEWVRLLDSNLWIRKNEIEILPN